MAEKVFQKSIKFESDLIEAIAFSISYQGEETSRLMNADLKFVGFVLMVCFCYMVFHLKSVFLAFFSLCNIFMSIPLTLCIYTYICRVDYFLSIHLSCILIK